MTTVAEPTAGITEPGTYEMPEDQYHAHPALSSSGARKLLPPSCPARFRYERDHPETRETKTVWDEGHAAHKLVLGAGPELVLVDRARWDTNEVKAQLAEIRAAGNVPLKRETYERVHAMADVIRRHPIASALFNAERGKPEQSLFWRDPLTGTMLRARLDWLPWFTTYRDGQPVRGTGLPGRVIIPDYKTCHSADPEKLAKAVYDFGYHQQAAWNIDGFKAVMPAFGHPDAIEPAFVFVCQEKTPPYLVTVIEPDAMALRIGRHLNRQAIETYAECTRTGHWPGYSDDVEQVGLPGWVENRYLQEIS